MYGQGAGGGLDPARETDALSPYVRAIRSHLPLVLLATLAALAGSVVWLLVRSPTYVATARLVATPLPQTDEAFLGLPLLRATAGDQALTIQTAASLVDSRAAAVLTARRVPGETVDNVLKAVTVQPQGQSFILAVGAKADTPDRAARLADTFARAALDVRRRALQAQLDARIRGLRSSGAALSTQPAPGQQLSAAEELVQLRGLRQRGDPTLALSETASRPTGPQGPPPALIVVLAGLGGLGLGLAGALTLELLERRVRDEDDVLELCPLPVLARVPVLARRGRRREKGPFPTPITGEALRTLAAQLPRPEGTARSILVASASAGDGKTTVAVQLAEVLAGVGNRVILIDFDVRKPDVARLLGLRGPVEPPGPGLDDALVEVPGMENLQFVPAPEGERDLLLLEGMVRRFPELLREAKGRADYVVVDTGPLAEYGDALRLAPHVDDVLLVVRPGSTNRADLSVTRDLFERVGIAPAGMVLVGVEPRGGGSYGRGYGALGADRVQGQGLGAS